MQKDLVWSAYYEDPARFVDVVDGLIAAGKLLIEANDLVEQDGKGIPPRLGEDEEKNTFAWSGSMQRDVMWKV